MPPTSNAATVTTSYDTAGTYDVIVTVADQAGLSDSAGTSIIVEGPEQPTPAPPTAVIDAPSQAAEGQLLTFDAGASQGSEPLVGYLWDFGDGTKANAVTIQHAYSKQGVYVVTLTVVDALGARGVSSTNVSVGAAATTAPTAKISGPTQITAGQELTLDGSGSVPGSDPIVSYAWNLGDASGTTLGTTATVRGTPVHPGVYQVVLTVTDAGGLSGSASQEVKVHAPLTGVIWQLASSLPEAPVTLGLSGKELGGSTGCNAYSGQFSATAEGQLAVTAVSQTGTVCQANVMAQESAYLTALEAAQSYSIDVDTLIIRHSAGSLQFLARGAIPH
jgi:PKD repeat protein